MQASKDKIEEIKNSKQRNYSYKVISIIPTDAAMSVSLQPFTMSCTTRDVFNPYESKPIDDH